MKFQDAQVGAALPPLKIPITVELVAGGAIATRDYFPGHLDLEAARALGSPHIFMNILTTSGLVQRYVEDWAGADCRFDSVKIKLGVPNYPGDTMTFTGEVTAVDEPHRQVEVGLVGRNSMGGHVTATVRVRLP